MSAADRPLRVITQTCPQHRAAAPIYHARAECLVHEGQRYPAKLVHDGHRIRYHAAVIQPDGLQIPWGAYCHHTVRLVRS